MDCRCVAGYYMDTTGGTSPGDCKTCPPGSYSPSTGLTSPCPVCPGNHFCPTTTEQSQCPSLSTSGNGSTSPLECRCVAGHTCVYARRIRLVVTLNVSLSDFQADVASVRTTFVQALHDAAGIQEERHAVDITINDVAPSAPTGRRLLGDATEYIDVYATVSGAAHLKHLKHHLAARVPEAHVAHTMRHEHRVRVLP